MLVLHDHEEKLILRLRQLSASIKPETPLVELPRVLIVMTAAEWQVQEWGRVARLWLADGPLDQLAQTRVSLP